MSAEPRRAQYRLVCRALAALVKGEVDEIAVMATIACASTTRSEIVVPVRDPAGVVRAVLDIDSDTPSSFSRADVRPLERICALVTRLYPQCPRPRSK